MIDHIAVFLNSKGRCFEIQMTNARWLTALVARNLMAKKLESDICRIGFVSYLNLVAMVISKLNIDRFPKSFASFFSKSQFLLSQSFDHPSGFDIIEESSKKRKSNNLKKSTFKRSRFNSQSFDKVRRKNGFNNQTTSFYTQNDNSVENRIFKLAVIWPTDRTLRDFWSIPKLY